MNNNITYIGCVSIKVNNKSETQTSNAGTVVLFKTLCDILTTTSVKYSPDIPCYMSVIRDDNGSITDDNLSKDYNYSSYYDVELVSSLLPITSRESRSDGSCVFASLLTHSQALTNQVNDTSNCYILLLNSKKQILAFSRRDFNSIREVFEDVNSQAVLEWEMRFDNKEIK